MNLPSLTTFLVVLLWEVDDITSTTNDDRNREFFFDNHPGYILSLPINITNVKQLSTKVSNKMDCVFACIGQSWCRSINFKITSGMDDHHICELIATDNHTNPKYLTQNAKFTHLNIKNPCEDRPCLNKGKCIPHKNRLDYRCKCVKGSTGENCQNVQNRDCSEIYNNTGERRDGVYTVKPDSRGSIQVYCDMTSDGGGWTLISRFSNNDTVNWMRDDGLWWYDVTTAQGNTTSTSANQDMISPAFWLVNGSEIKITSSNDSSNTALLRTTSNCLGSRTFRSMMTSNGTFRNRTIWSNDQCLGSCNVTYGGDYLSTSGFSQAQCSGNIQASNKIGFWCNWDSGDASVMMIGGGGKTCGRADHGIGITENNFAAFAEWADSGEQDFGNDAYASKSSSSYSLNLWIRSEK